MIGIYGVLSNVVHQQTREIGVRVALGATTGDLIRMVVGRALTMAASLLYEIRPYDAIAFLGSALLLAGLAVIASLVPAWRATRADPLMALRADWRGPDCTWPEASR